MKRGQGSEVVFRKELPAQQDQSEGSKVSDAGEVKYGSTACLSENIQRLVKSKRVISLTARHTFLLYFPFYTWPTTAAKAIFAY